MSKIAVAGNASGTGTLTIAAPNTNSDRTLTLPDATGTFVTADGSGNITIASGTANGVTYLNGSKVLTSGSALVFDGTNLGLGVTPNFSSGTGLEIERASATATLRLQRATGNPSSLEIRAAADQVEIIATSNTPLVFGVNSAEKMHLDSSGNLGLGVTPSAWASNYKSVQTNTGGAIACKTDGLVIAQNCYFNGTNWVNNRASTYTTKYDMNVAGNGVHAWYTYGSSFGTVGNTIPFTQAMTLDASGNLGVGTTSPSNRIQAKRDGTTDASNSQFIAENRTGASGQYALYGTRFDNGSGSGFTPVAFGAVQTAAAGRTAAFIIAVSDTDNIDLTTDERVRIDSAGNLLVGQTSGSYNIIAKSRTNDVGEVILSVERQQTSVSALLCYGISQSNYNAANSGNKMGRDGTTLRSLNAGGTVNASGADYAEYMVKSGEFTVAKGDVVGIDAQGKLTNVFADAISFCVKSTDPSYVGGDIWGTEDAIGLVQPTQPTQRQATEDAETETDEEFTIRQSQYESDKATFEAALEAARQTVDRIAFAGQVPVNVLGATAGQYIIPVNDNGSTKGEAVSNPTFEQYQQAVGKVIAIEVDGRARIIVKVA